MSSLQEKRLLQITWFLIKASPFQKVLMAFKTVVCFSLKKTKTKVLTFKKKKKTKDAAFMQFDLLLLTPFES